MQGIVIRYTYDGDEAEWKAAIDAFIDALNSDQEVAGKFRYAVNTGQDGKTRVHVGRWDSAETLATVQSRDYFKTFAAAVQGYAGDTLDAQRVGLVRETA